MLLVKCHSLNEDIQNPGIPIFVQPLAEKITILMETHLPVVSLLELKGRRQMVTMNLTDTIGHVIVEDIRLK